MRPTRRQLLTAAAAVPLAAARRPTAAAEPGFRPQVTQVPELAGKLGLVTASLTPHLGERPAGGRIRLVELPKILSQELGLAVIDFNTLNFPSLEPAYVERLRAAVDGAGAVATNLKMNQKVDMASARADERAEAMRQYRQAIDAAGILGCRWVRPLPRSDRPDEGRLRAAFDELIDYAGARGITVLLENFGWSMADPEALIRLADAIGRDRIAIGPDTGNWTADEVRYPGLTRLFPRAVTCDFKAKTLGPDGEHGAYDLRKCFDLAWRAGFRGPWCLEHGHADRATAFRGLAWLRDRLSGWIAGESGALKA